MVMSLIGLCKNEYIWNILISIVFGFYLIKLRKYTYCLLVLKPSLKTYISDHNLQLCSG